jgi:transposase
VPDEPFAAGDEVAALRAANARLRQVVEAKDTEIAALRSALEAAHARQGELIRRHAELTRVLELRVAELERRLGMDSGNSSTPPSKEPLGAKARRKAARQASLRERSKQRRPGGQPGHEGAGLEPERNPDRTERADPPAECRWCGAGLAGAGPAGRGWGQVWDIPPVRLEKVHWLLPKLRCRACGKVTCADPPDGRAGTVVYGPDVNTAAILLGSEGNVPVERTAMLMAALLGAPVSAGFVARAHERLAGRLEQAGFDEAVKAALRAEPVVCADETPVNVIRNTGQDGSVMAGSPHVVTVRAPDERLVWYAATPSRSSEAIKDLGVLEGYHGILVRDDYAGWAQFDAQLAGVQQCCQHLSRHLKGVHALHPDWQRWAEDVRQVLSEARAAVQEAAAAGHTQLDPELLAGLRRRYDKAVHWGEITNRLRDWDDGKNHPGYVLARRLKAKASQVWLFTRNFAVPWTNNASEQAIKGPKRHQAVSGYWHSLATLARYCRVRSYLVTSRNHGIRPIDAIHAALTGRPWLPIPVSA